MKKGDKVLAKWPGSRRFEKAVIVEQLSAGGYKVEYEDGTHSEVKTTEVKVTVEKTTEKSPTKNPSPKRGRPRSLSKSPGRPAKEPKERATSKSPGRSPKALSDSKGRKADRSVSRSPARTKTSKSPAKPRGRSRSPTKTTKAKSPAKARSKSPAKTPKPKTPKVKTPKTPPKTTSPGRKAGRPKKQSEELFSSPDSSPSPVKKLVTIQKSPATPGSPARRGRKPKKLLEGTDTLKSKAELVPILEKLEKLETLAKDKVKEVEMEKEEVDTPSRKIYSTRSKLTSRIQMTELKARSKSTSGVRMKAGLFGILFSTLSIILFPAHTIYLALNFARKNTNLLSLPQLPKLSGLFSYKIAGIYLGFVALQALMNAIPVGRVVKGFHAQHDKPRLLYRISGFYMLLVNLVALGLLAYLDQPVSFVTDNFFKFTCTATVFSFVLSIGLYIRALLRPLPQINQLGNTGCTPYDFHHGHELNPRIGPNYDLKMWVLRTGFIGWAIVNVCLTYKCFLLNGCVHYELALAVGAQLLYILDRLWFEENTLATALVMHDGLGFGLSHAALAVLPFTFTLPVYYLVHQKTNLPLYCLAGMALIFLFGLIMNHKSLSIKALVKRNPENPAVSGLRKITASGHEKVLVSSGWWGLIRHPNYTSEVLMFIAWTLPCGFQTAMPYLPALLVLVVLVHRCFHVESIMARNYRDAYQQYKHRVPHRMVPYVF